jgi:hypothetical protein
MAAPPPENASDLPRHKLSVLMPIYNERQSLEQMVARVLASSVGMELELIAIDDGSTDGSWEILQRLAGEDARIKPFRLKRNAGKGAAVRAAIDRMTGTLAVVQDADLEYDPADYPRLLAPLLAGEAEAVYGSRFLAEYRGSRISVHYLGNRGLTCAFNALYCTHLTDMETCYKALLAETLRRLKLTANSFAIEPEITARLVRSGARIAEVPISYTGRTVSEGKKIRYCDGLLALGQIVKSRLF